LAVAVSLVVFGESANLTGLLVGGAIILLALVINNLSVNWSKMKPQRVV